MIEKEAETAQGRLPVGLRGWGGRWWRLEAHDPNLFLKWKLR